MDERGVDGIDRLIIPSCDGLLDAFNGRQTNYKIDSRCWLSEGSITLFCLTLFSFLYSQRVLGDLKVHFKISGFKRYISYNEGGKSIDLIRQFQELNAMGYFWAGEYFEKAFIVEFDDTKRGVSIDIPYFDRVYREMKKISGEYSRWGRKISTGKPTYTALIYVEVLKERNKCAVEMVIELVKAIERRGPLAEDRDGHISVDTLINRCPTLYRRVQAIEVKEKNRIVKNAFKKAQKLLADRTDIYKTFEGLSIRMDGKVVKFIYEKRIFNGEKELFRSSD